MKILANWRLGSCCFGVRAARREDAPGDGVSCARDWSPVVLDEFTACEVSLREESGGRSELTLGILSRYDCSGFESELMVTGSLKGLQVVDNERFSDRTKVVDSFPLV